MHPNIPLIVILVLDGKCTSFWNMEGSNLQFLKLKKEYVEDLHFNFELQIIALHVC